MIRDLSLLDQQSFDLVVIGGGIFGACAAWDASQRGLSVALIERGDFGGATSANSLKMVHGGIRYLQHLDLYRIRQSSAERAAFLRIAPHLVKPLPIVVPTYGYLQKGKPFLRLGMGLYDLMTSDRNREIRDPSRRVPWTRGLSKSEVLDLFPGLGDKGLTGAAVFADGQMYNPPRLVWAVVNSAARNGAVVANHLEVTELLQNGSDVVGVKALDGLTGETLEIRSKFVLNAAGPYAESLLGRALNRPATTSGSFSRDACFLVKRRFESPFALAVPGATSDPDAKLSRGARHLFLCPWRQYTLIGVWHQVYSSDPDDFRVTDEELEGFLAEVEQAYPPVGLTIDDVTMVNSGLVPFGENREGAVNLRYGHRSRLIDHAKTDGLDGLLSLIGVRYTTGRREAAHAIDQVSARLGREHEASRTSSTPVFGGDIDGVDQLVREAREKTEYGVSQMSLESLAYNHGSDYPRVLQLCADQSHLAKPIDSSAVIAAEVVHAVKEEMAMTLSDIVFGRTDLGTGERPSTAALEECAGLAAKLLDWSPATKSAQIEEARRHPAFWHRRTGQTTGTSNR